MTFQGAEYNERTDPEVITELTISTMEMSVTGIVSLSGGLSEEEALAYLYFINKVIRKAYWNIGFSYGRALQHSCIKAWKGRDAHAAQKALLARAQANSEASKGCYVASSQASSDEALFVSGYKY